MGNRRLSAGALVIGFALSLHFAKIGIAGCITSGSSSWQTFSFASQSGQFTFTFDATPAAAPIDAVTAIASGAGSTFDDFACAIRFETDTDGNGTPVIDARNGDVYQAENVVPYGAGETFHFRVEIDVVSHTYSVFVTPPGETEETILACGYDFPTSQQAVTSLDHWGVWADTGDAHEVCDVVASSGGGAPIDVPADHTTIQAAIDAAVSGDEIVVAPGTYNETIDFAGKLITLRSSDGRDVTTIDATGIGGSVVTLARCEIAAIDGFTITGGTGTWAAQINPDLNLVVGGGIYSAGTALTITECRIQGNHNLAPDHNDHRAEGGGLYAHYAIVVDTLFESNGEAGLPQSAWPVRSIGGGASVFGGIVMGCEFSGNQSAATGDMGNGGGGLSAGPTVSVVDCRFVENSAGHQAHGGGVRGGGWVERCVFIENFAFEGGGAFSPNLHDCVFLRNQGNYGSAIAGPCTVTNCTFNSHRTVWVDYHGQGPITARNCTFVHNGGSLSLFSGGADIRNCLIWNSTSQLHTGSPTVRYCNIEGGWPGEGNIDLDPLFFDADGLDDVPGTEDDDVHLFFGSPCIDAGDNGAVTPDLHDLDNDGNTAEPTPFDLDGNPRLVDDPLVIDTGAGSPPIVDMGAYELVPPSNQQAGPRLWTNPVGGAFEAPGNWVPAVPGSADEAVFFLPAPYIVELGGDVHTASTHIADGIVLLDLDGFTYDAVTSLSIGLIDGKVAELILLDGTASCGAVRVGDDGTGTLWMTDTVVLDAQSVMIETGLLAGSGLIQSDVVNLDALEPGWLGEALTIAGNYAQTGVRSNGASAAGALLIEIGDAGSCATNTNLDVAGAAVLGGSLIVSRAAGCDPPVGSTFTILSAAEGVTSTFDVALLPSIAAGASGPRFFNVTYPPPGLGPGPATVTISVQDLEALIGFNPFDPNVPLSGAATAVAVGNLDASAGDDLAITVAGSGGASGTLFVLLNDGTGQSFTTSQFTVGVNPVDVEIGNFDGAGLPDLVVANSASNSVSIVLSPGGSPIQLDPQAVGSAPSSVGAFVVNGQSFDDLAVSLAGDGAVRIFDNDGTGELEDLDDAIVISGASNPTAIEPENVDDDKDEDLTMIDLFGDKVIVHPNNGGAFNPDDALELATGTGVFGLILADLNNDQAPDLITNNLGSAPGEGTVTIFLNESEGSAIAFTPGLTLPTVDFPVSVTAGDFDADLDVDLAILGSVSGDAVIQVLRNDLIPGGELVFAPDQEPPAEASAALIGSGALDAVPGDDLVTINDTGSGGGLVGESIPPLSVLLAVAQCPADFNGDGAVGFNDLVQLLIHWGPCNAPSACPWDFNGDGMTGFNDLTTLLVAWGDC